MSTFFVCGLQHDKLYIFCGTDTIILYKPCLENVFLGNLGRSNKGYMKKKIRQPMSHGVAHPNTFANENQIGERNEEMKGCLGPNSCVWGRDVMVCGVARKPAQKTHPLVQQCAFPPSKKVVESRYHKMVALLHLRVGIRNLLLRALIRFGTHAHTRGGVALAVCRRVGMCWCLALPRFFIFVPIFVNSKEKISSSHCCTLRSIIWFQSGKCPLKFNVRFCNPSFHDSVRLLN